MPSKPIEEILKETRIYQILRPKLVSAPPETRLEDALDLMRREKAGYVVVADKRLNVVGMFTEREVLMKVLKPGVSLGAPVSKYMRTDVHTLQKSDSLQAAIDVMFEFNSRHIPLLDEFGQLSNVLSIRTLVNFLAELFPTEVFNLPPRPQIHDTVEGG